jgi:hypothetical protein
MDGIQVTELLSKLSRSEQRAVYDTLGHQFSQAKDYTPSTIEAETWDAITDALGLGKMPISTFIASYGKSKYRKACADVRAYVIGAAGAQRKPVTLELTKVCLRCLAAMLKSWDMPLSATILMNNVPHLATAVDRAFPGYAAAGLLVRVVKVQAAAL